jgi:hypothetical protein
VKRATDVTRIEDLNMFIISSAEICKMNKKRILGDNHIISHPRWFDEKCLEYKKKTNKCLRLFRNADNSNQEYSKCKYLDARRSYKNLREAKKKLYLSQLDSNLTNVKNCKEFYKALNYYCPKRTDIAFNENVKP